jgi:hypothetical protein
MLRRTILVAVVALSLPAVAQAEPSDNGECRQDANDVFVAASDEGTRGDFMSDVIFGNEPNEENGQTVPSQSPGPFVNTGANEPPRNDRTFGFTGGDLQAAVKAICN